MKPEIKKPFPALKRNSSDIPPYGVDRKGYFRIVEGSRFRPVDVVNGSLVCLSPTLVMSRWVGN